MVTSLNRNTFSVRSVCLLAALLIGLVSGGAPALARGHMRASRGGVIVIRLKSAAAVRRIEQRYHLREIKSLSHGTTYAFAPVATGSGPAAASTAAQVASSPDVVSAEPDYVFSAPESAAGSLTADPKSIGAHPEYIQEMYLDQWAAPAIGLDTAHITSQGAGITIAVVDTGVETDHPDLVGHLVPGFDFLDDTPNVTDPQGGADSGHGTFIAGLITLCAPQASIMPIRSLDVNGQGDEVDVANGIYFAVDHGANIINLSLGSYDDSSVVDQAVAYAEQHNVLVVVAAGNDNSNTPEYPAATPGVVSVAATDGSDQKADFSNYGGHIVISAPGTDLYSDYDDGGYAFGAGTSFATPLVAGVAALIWAADPTMTASDVATALTSSATNIDSTNPDYSGQLGSGRLNAGTALPAPQDQSGSDATSGQAGDGNNGGGGVSDQSGSGNNSDSSGDQLGNNPGQPSPQPPPGSQP